MPFKLSSRVGATAVLAVFLTCPAVAAQPLGLFEAQALAVARSQQLAGNRSSVAAAREMAGAAGQFPDPVLRLGVENVPINGADRFSLSQDFMTMTRLGLSQEITRSEKRQLRAEQFEREALRIQAEGQMQVSIIRRDTALAWIDRYYLGLMRDIALRQIEETQLQLQTARAGFGAGRNSQTDVVSARTAVVSLEDRLSQIDRRDRSAAQNLARWIGQDAQRPLLGTPPWQKSHLEGSRLEDHFLAHPDLLVLNVQIESAETEIRLAQASTKPDWNVEISYSQRGSAYANMVSLGVSVPLQWDRANRQQREVAAKVALAEAARAKYEEMRRSHDAEVRNLLNDWQNGKSRVARHQNELLPLARQRSESSLMVYRTGKADLASTLLARRDEVEARLQALAIEMETARVWAQLNFLIPEPNTTVQVGEKR